MQAKLLLERTRGPRKLTFERLHVGAENEETAERLISNLRVGELRQSAPKMQLGRFHSWKHSLPL